MQIMPTHILMFTPGQPAAQPSGGRPWADDRQAKPTCPKCTSTDIRKLALVFADRRTSGLLRQAAPPPRRRWVAWSAVAGVFALATVASIGRPALALVAAALATAATVLAIRGRKHNAEVHPSLVARWEQSFMCNRCGEVFAPS
jgi:hypothetical protein